MYTHWIFSLAIFLLAVYDNNSSTKPKELSVMVLLPQTLGAFKFPFGAEMSGGAVIVAIKDIEAEGLLPNHKIKIDYVNSKCNAVHGFGNAFHAFSNATYDVIIGPACSAVCRMVGRLAAYLNIPCFSGLCDNIEMIDKTEFQTLTRFLGSFEKTATTVRKILEYYKWQRVSIIWERHPDVVWLYMANALKSLLVEKNNFTIAAFLQVGQESDLTVADAVKEAARVSRIILLATTGSVVRTVAVEAEEQGLINGEYVFISVDFYTQKRTFGDFNWKRNDDKDEAARKAFKTMFFVSYYNRDTSQEYLQFEARVKNISKSIFGFEYFEDEVMPYPAANLYEAFYLYAISLNETLSEGGNISDGKNVSRRLWGRSFKSITGDLTLNNNGDREQAYTIKHMQNLDTGEIMIVGHYFSHNTSLILTKTITWYWGGPPLDHPRCGYDNEFCEEDQMRQMIILLIAVVTCLVVVVVTVLLLVYFFYRRLMWIRNVNEMKWKLNLSDIMQDKRKNRSRVGLRSTACLMSMTTMSLSSQASKLEQEYINTGTFNGVTVALKRIKHLDEVKLTNELKEELTKLYEVLSSNVLRFVGASVEPGNIYTITEYCAKGSLQDILENDNVDLDWSFKNSLINDILKGLQFLHHSNFKCHGNMKSSNCLVDNRFSVKLGDFAPVEWQRYPNRPAKDLLWMSPEVLGNDITVSQNSDIYSLGIILQEIIERKGPFYVDSDRDNGNLYDAEDIIKMVKSQRNPPFRPTIAVTECAAKLRLLVISCWAENPEERPSLKEVTAEFAAIHGNKGKVNIMDSLMSRMEQYANNLEGLVEERTGKYLEEKKRVEDLLHRLLPPTIATQIQEKGNVEPETFECVTIYFSDIVGFTKLSSMSTPVQIIDFLNDLYTTFDAIIADFDVYKVETIGDAYMVVSGLPNRNGDNHAAEIAKMSLRLLQDVKKFKLRHQPDHQLHLRIGLHSGPCAAGVVGLTMPRYCLFGDTVNTASRMESNGEPLRIHISHSTQELLVRIGNFATSERGLLEVKGKGMMVTHWLEAYEPDIR